MNTKNSDDLLVLRITCMHLNPLPDDFYYQNFQCYLTLSPIFSKKE